MEVMAVIICILHTLDFAPEEEEKAFWHRCITERGQWDAACLCVHNKEGSERYSNKGILNNLYMMLCKCWT